ncbi:hypothetical protein PTKIN_Ptkin16aG0496200 [Pterospermum kingtungense]
MGFFSIIWTVWLARNEVVFRQGIVKVEELIDLSILKTVTWALGKWSNLGVGISEFNQNPELVRSISSSWMRPEVCCFKFNVDDSARGKPGPTGIGRVMRDHEEVVKIRFSKPIGIADCNLAELLVIREAYILFTASQWSHSHKLVIESDSSNVVKWVSYPSIAPWAMRRFFNQIEALKSGVQNWRVIHVNRERNFMANTLAKEAVLREDELIEFLE